MNNFNSFRILPPGPTRQPGSRNNVGALRLLADGGMFEGVKRGLGIIGEELPKWWGSDETSDLRKGLRQTGLGAAYTFGPGLPMLPMVGAELYDVFGRDENEVRMSPTPGSFSWAEKQLGRDLFDPTEEQYAMMSGFAQMAPLFKSIPSLISGIRKAPKTIEKGMNKVSDIIEETLPSKKVVKNAFNDGGEVMSPAVKNFMEL